MPPGRRAPAETQLPPGIGQGVLSAPGMAPEAVAPPPIDLTRRVSISGLIARLSEARNLDPSMVTERDMRVMTPGQIRAGLYVPEGKRDRDVPDARDGLILPAEEFGFIATSPLHIAREAMRGVKAKRRADPDKVDVNNIAGRAAGHALQTKIKQADTLVSALQSEANLMRTITRELGSARNTGHSARYRADNLLLRLTTAETAIFRALSVAATSLNWDEEKHIRAMRTVEYQLFGRDVRRHRNWVGYAVLAGEYAQRRRGVVLRSKGPLQTELKTYQPYLDEAS